MEIVMAVLVVLGAVGKVVTTPQTDCKQHLTDPCKPFLERQIDYDQCRNLVELKKTEGLQP